MIELIAYATLALVLTIVLGFFVYGIWKWVSSRQQQVAYVDKFLQMVDILKLNCPKSMKQKPFERAPDKRMDGAPLGFIQGVGNMQLKNVDKNKKIYDIIAFTKNKVKWWNILSWNEKVYLAVIDPLKRSSLQANKLRWYVSGIDGEGYYIFESGGDLTPDIILKETAAKVDLKQTNIMLKQLSERFDTALDSNVSIRGQQKLGSEINLNEKK